MLNIWMLEKKRQRERRRKHLLRVRKKVREGPSRLGSGRSLLLQVKSIQNKAQKLQYPSRQKETSSSSKNWQLPLLIEILVINLKESYMK